MADGLPIPGSFAPGFTPAPLVSRTPVALARVAGVKSAATWTMGECRVSRFRDAHGIHGVVAHDARYPTWDEIKVARYRTLPLDRWFGLVLPPPAHYVDDPLNPYVFELTEVEL